MLSDKDKQRMIILRQRGMIATEIAQIYGVSRQRAYQVLNYYKGYASINAQVMEQLPNFCQICGTKRKYDKEKRQYNLQIHHKDKNTQNNNIENLLRICTKCHLRIHKYKINDPPLVTGEKLQPICYNRYMESYQDIKAEWKKRRQEIYNYYKEVRNPRLVAEKYKITYPRVLAIVKKEQYATSE